MIRFLNDLSVVKFLSYLNKFHPLISHGLWVLYTYRRFFILFFNHKVKNIPHLANGLFVIVLHLHLKAKCDYTAVDNLFHFPYNKQISCFKDLFTQCSTDWAPSCLLAQCIYVFFTYFHTYFHTYFKCE